MKAIYNNFKNPPTEYGEVAFFWWCGDKITKEKLLWILDQLKDSHICGLQINYAHSDKGGYMYGLTLKSDPTPLSDEWWELVEWFAKECKKYNISISLSDYTLGSPGQGFYTDEVLKKYPDITGQKLEFKNGSVIVTDVPNSVDPMDERLGCAIIDEFFGKFEQHMPGYCGNTVNFFFSDELNFNIEGNLWNDKFAEKFKEIKGYDIQPYLNGIFEDIGDITPKIRLDYYDVIVKLSEKAYFKPVFDWHNDRKMTCGCDHGGRGSWITEFGDYFATQKWNVAPGNDQPRLESNIIKNKVSSSISHLYKRPRTWLEGFYSSGWGTTSAQVADAVFRNFAMGHNLLSLHGLYYSTYGSMWEWAPPCNHYHMPYWTEMKELLLCTKRLSYILTRGVHCCDVAIFYPVADEQAGLQKEVSPKVAFDAAEYLYSHGIDFDFIDFESMERSDISNKMINVSDEHYKVLILPSMKAIRFDTIKKIEEFAKAGGIVINIGSIPVASDRAGLNDDVLDKVVSNIMETAYKINDVSEILTIIDNNFCRDFKTDSKNPYYLHRKIDDNDIYMVYNVEKNKRCFFRAFGRPTLWNPWNGEIYPVKSFETDENGTYIDMPLASDEVHLIVFDNTTFIEATKKLSDNNFVINVEGEWNCEIKPTMNNKYGDYRLPAFDGFIGAEARTFKYRVTQDDCADPSYNDSDWNTGTYSYGTYFWLCENGNDEDMYINMTAPTKDFTPYDFSIKTGLQYDAGPQDSYHGLKGKISSDFLALGEKILHGSGQACTYIGDKTRYLFTTVYSDSQQKVNIITGDIKPDNIWINHIACTKNEVLLNKGTNYVLLKYTKAGRTHFIFEKKKGFVQTAPLCMKWYNNPDILLFDANPKMNEKTCWYRFCAPPALKSLKIDAEGDVYVFCDGKKLKKSGNLFTVDTVNKHCSTVAIKIVQKRGFYECSAIKSPIELNCSKGLINIGDWSLIDGLRSYSGGILYSKDIQIDTDKNVILNLGKISSSAQIYINEIFAGAIVAPPYSIDITDYINKGRNKIEILIHNTMANNMTTIPTQYNGKINSGFIG